VKKALFKKTFGRCPYCGYAWVLRVPDYPPKMCPLCKKRFANPGSPSPSWNAKPVKLWTEEFETYGDVRKRLEKLNEKKQ